MQSRANVMIIGPADATGDPLRARLEERGLTTCWREARDNFDGAARCADVAVVLQAAATAHIDAATLRAVEQLVDQSVATIVWGTTTPERQVGGPLVEWLATDASLDELVGRVSTLTRYAPLVRAMERELHHLQRLGEQLNRHFGELDQEMRLAGRLQRDFLPPKMPNANGYRFEVLYRPASWVSGDMYDAFRIDEEHLGIFIADAMGHGVAAGLLTMFLRQALVPKRVGSNSYTIVQPAEALNNLHECLVRQHLPNCQFVTAAYAILNTRSHQMTLARAGHPYPVHVDAGGTLREVVSGGSLLGLPDIPASFDEVALELRPGDKLLLYTDGMEDLVATPRDDEIDETVFTTELVRWAPLPGQDLMQLVASHLDNAEGSLAPADDVTMLTLERAR